MHLANGRSSRASGLSSIELVGPLTAARFLFLVSLGMLSVLLHKTFNYPLKLPGHHGLEIMALFVLGRLSCTHRWAATIVAFSAAATAGVTNAEHNPTSAMLNILPGVGIDMLLMLVPNWRQHLFVVPIAAALAFALKPVFRLVIAQLTGMQFGSLQAGVLYPLSTHLMYGFLGAMVSVLLWRETLKRVERR